MAKTAVRRKRARDVPAGAPEPMPEIASGQEVIHGPAFGRINYLLMGASLAVITVGFLALARGSITLAPILLVVGYLVLVPTALLKR